MSRYQPIDSFFKKRPPAANKSAPAAAKASPAVQVRDDDEEEEVGVAPQGAGAGAGAAASSAASLPLRTPASSRIGGGEKRQLRLTQLAGVSSTKRVRALNKVVSSCAPVHCDVWNSSFPVHSRAPHLTAPHRTSPHAHRTSPHLT